MEVKGQEFHEKAKIKNNKVIIHQPLNKPSNLYEFPVKSDYFSGKEEQLKDILIAIENCEKGKTCNERSLAITGLGGLGKSEIVKVLASNELMIKYDYVYWFNAQTKDLLNSGIEKLASRLQTRLGINANQHVPLTLPIIYDLLEKNYKNNGIFIFDNAESFKSENDVLGVEEFMEPNIQCKKTVCIITTRHSWPFRKHNIQCIEIKPLTESESYECLARYAGLQKFQPDFTPSLDEAIKSLVDLADGVPLVLSILGPPIADNETKMKYLAYSTRQSQKYKQESFQKIETRVKNFIDILKSDASIKQSYGNKLRIILESTMAKLEAEKDGKVATELLNVLSHLSPNSLYVGLLNGILCDKDFLVYELLSPRFDCEDSDLSVMAGLSVLRMNSVIRIENMEHNEDGQVFQYDMIRIHRLLHDIPRDNLAATRGPSESLLKIIKFFECNSSNNEEFREHISFILTNYLEGQVKQLETHSILMLTLQLGEKELFLKIRDTIRLAATLNTDETKSISLLGLLFQVNSSESTRLGWEKLQEDIFALSPDYRKKYWVIELCSYALQTMSGKYEWQDYQPSQLSNWLVENYMQCGQSKRRYCDILRNVYLCDVTRDCNQDQEFLWTVFNCTSEYQRWRFWWDLNRISKSKILEAGQRKKIMQNLFHPTKSDLFTMYLQMSPKRLELFFLEDWCLHFTACIREVAEYPELAELLLSSKSFTKAFLDITISSLKHLTESYSSNSITTEAQDSREAGVVDLIDTWCKLFKINVALYDNVGTSMDAEVESWLEGRRQSNRKDKPIYSFFYYISQFQVNCSNRTKTWIRELTGHIHRIMRYTATFVPHNP